MRSFGEYGSENRIEGLAVSLSLASERGSIPIAYQLYPKITSLAATGRALRISSRKQSPERFGDVLAAVGVGMFNLSE